MSIVFSNSKESTWKETAVTAVFVALAVSMALLARIWLDQFGLPSPFILFYPTIVICAWYKRFKAGLMAIALSISAVAYFFLEPNYSFHISRDEDVLAVILFGFVGLVITSLIQLLHKAIDTAEAAKQRLEEVFESMSDAVVIIDPLGKFTYLNPQAEKILLKTKAELLGKSFWSEFPDIGGAGFWATIHEVSQSRGSKTLELYAAFLERWLEARIYPSENGISIYFNDITDRKQSESVIKRMNEELEAKVQKRTAALQEATANIESFSYSVAHDLRAPMRAISGFTQMLKEDHAHQLDPVALDYLEKIMKASSRMDRLILDLLAYIRLSREDFVLQPVDYGSVVDQVLRSHQTQIEAQCGSKSSSSAWKCYCS